MKVQQNLQFPESGVANISLETLKQTRSSQLCNGAYHPSCPLESWELVEKIGNLVADITKTNPDLTELFVYEESIDRNFQIPEQLRNLPATHADRIAFEKGLSLNHFRIDRFIGKMLVNLGNPDVNFAIGFSYSSDLNHAKKICIGVGTNLRICSNFQIFGNQLCANYKRYEQVAKDFKGLLKSTSAWLNKYQENFEFHNQVLETFRNTKLTNSNINEIFGELLVNSRVENFPKPIQTSVLSANNFIIEKNLFTATQVGYLVDESYKSTNFKRNEDSSASVYELLNWGTDILNFKRAKHNTIDSLLPCNNKYCSFLLNKFLKN
jgi:hypothetical protein